METVIENYKNINKNDVKFITLAEWGAMGASGSIGILSLTGDKLIKYSGHSGYSAAYIPEKIMDMDEFYQVFPEFKNTSCVIGECCGLPEGWKYLDLGYGNNLFISDDVYDYFKILFDAFPSMYEIAKWETCAIMTLRLLNNDLIDKKAFLEYVKNFHKDYEIISLNKIDSPKIFKHKRDFKQHTLINKLLIIIGIIAVSALMYILIIR